MQNEPRRPLTAAEALQELLAGNARYVAGQSRHPHQDPTRRRSLADGQQPIATIIGCSDSRVPPELVFDAGLGDLFVIRTAGHVLGSTTLASLEFAVVALRTPLIAVLAHSCCGAVTAAVSGGGDGHHLPRLVARIADGIGDAVTAAGGEQGTPLAAVVAAATRTHLAREVAYLRDEDPAVAPRHADGRVAVVGLYEDIVSGRVEICAGLT